MVLTERLKAFYEKSKRVWLVLKKPSKKEFEMVAKVSAIGVLLLGAIGFLIAVIIKLLFFS
ncbi:MAG: protein translocase SEC61 complex subunit gamma [Candidatus Pacearchaeota archaeon]|jgi:protein transport protein SEC61 subunit gamma-like protein